LHHGIDPAGVPLLAPWLRAMWWLARPLATLGITPSVLTVLGPGAAVGAAAVASSVPLVALLLVVVAVLMDGLDGAVAVVADRAGARGPVLDRIADRVSDCAFAVVLWRCGAPWELAAAAGALSLLHEAVRDVRGGRLRSAITVAERPSRTVCTVLACLCAAISAAAWPPTVCAAVWVALAVVGLGQLSRAGGRAS